ncbi:MAG: SGNH/GDSL hydrolase family protein [Clostridium sp.]|nr:SGNH/GDSL hydrolase family protein [Clostridium sp.]
MAEERRKEQFAEEQQLAELEKQDSFYQKLSDGFDVNILVVGDSIGAGTGASDNLSAWFNLLTSYLEETYSVKVLLTNISMGGNTSYAGYVRTMYLEDETEYDLAVVCYGQNDSTEDFSLYYESILRAIKNKYKKCEIISILESSQREYTKKMLEIQSLCEAYQIPIADTIAGFAKSSYVYSDLTDDGVHPNDLGYKIYFETVKDVIDKGVNEYRPYGKWETGPVNENVTCLDHFAFFPVEDFEKTDDNTYSLNISSPMAVLGVDYICRTGDNKMEIYIDGQKYVDSMTPYDHDFMQRRIFIVSEICTIQEEIKVVFEKQESAEGFKGIALSW